MTLRKRIDRLEGGTMQPDNVPFAIRREIVKPGTSGPELVALMLRPLHGKNMLQLDRTPCEDETAFQARFDAACAGLANC